MTATDPIMLPCPDPLCAADDLEPCLDRAGRPIDPHYCRLLAAAEAEDDMRAHYGYPPLCVGLGCPHPRATGDRWCHHHRHEVQQHHREDAIMGAL